MTSDIEEQIDKLSVPSKVTKSGKEITFDPEVLKDLITKEIKQARLELLKDLADTGELHHSVFDYRLTELNKD